MQLFSGNNISLLLPRVDDKSTRHWVSSQYIWRQHPMGQWQWVKCLCKFGKIYRFSSYSGESWGVFCDRLPMPKTIIFNKRNKKEQLTWLTQWTRDISIFFLFFSFSLEACVTIIKSLPVHRLCPIFLSRSNIVFSSIKNTQSSFLNTYVQYDNRINDLKLTCDDAWGFFSLIVVALGKVSDTRRTLLSHIIIIIIVFVASSYHSDLSSLHIMFDVSAHLFAKHIYALFSLFILFSSKNV